MSQGPLDTIPKTNYPPLLTKANYQSTKQLINQVLNEDQEYVSWKLNQLRNGGPNSVSSELLQSVPHQGNRNFHKKNRKIMKKRSTTKIPGLPSNLTFVADLYREKMEAEATEIENSLQENGEHEIPYDEQFKLLVTSLDTDQTNRFEVFHRTALNKSQVKKLAGTVINQSVNENIRVFLQAIGKVFAGEIIEQALAVKEKWLVSLMLREFDNKKEIAKRLKKFLKKLTKLVSNYEEEDPLNYSANTSNNSSVDEEEEDTYFDDEEEYMTEIKKANALLRSTENTPELKQQLIAQYNLLVKQFNNLDVSVEKYTASPLLPEHIREAWRLHRLQSETIPAASWRTQGGASGTMFR
ncbi:Transcription initiation factor TFIID subunit 11 [Nakaseomyces bracarensis]|uniref:Transcription initiation factor TFIID subunit 11 n=1 Tax=Nakaseomyces bracarensis TaxID=273131 RepID=A0ABR4NWZ7_9SACH